MLRRLYRAIAVGLVAVSGLGIAGCEHRIFEDTIFDSEYIARYLPNEEKVLRESWFEPRPTGMVQSYCYRSIGTVECYPQPLTGEDYRLNGYFGPAPK